MPRITLSTPARRNSTLVVEDAWIAEQERLQVEQSYVERDIQAERERQATARLMRQTKGCCG